MKKEWNDVREFHEKFGHPVAPQPRMVERGRALSRGKWMNEEVAEFLVAQDIYEQADAMIDLIYFALGTLVEMGLEADELFDIVQKANMAKLWSDGKPHYNPKDGKVIVEKVNVISRHQKPRKQGEEGGIIKREAPIYACKVQKVCPKCNKPTRIGHKVEGDKKVRICKKCGAEI